jgi:hypothetical protein
MTSPPTNGHPAPVPLGGSRRSTELPRANPSQPSNPTPKNGPEQHASMQPQPSKGSRGTARCIAHRSNGEQCGNYPIRGGTVCRIHGGAVPAVKAKAAARLAAQKVDAEIAKVLATEPLTGIDNPWEAFSRATAEAIALKNVSGALVNDLEGRLRYEAHGAGTEQLRAEVALYERALDRSGKFLDLMIRHDVEGKRLALDVAQLRMKGEYLGRFLDSILDGLELTDEQRSLIPVILPAALRSLDKEKPLPTTFYDGLVRDKILGTRRAQ